MDHKKQYIDILKRAGFSGVYWRDLYEKVYGHIEHCKWYKEQYLRGDIERDNYISLVKKSAESVRRTLHHI